MSSILCETLQDDSEERQIEAGDVLGTLADGGVEIDIGGDLA